MIMRRAVFFGLLPVLSVHLAARLVYNIQEATSSAMKYICGRYVSDGTIISFGDRQYTKADCDRYSSLLSYVTNYSPSSPSEFIMTHIVGGVAVVILVLLAMALFYYGYFILTGKSLHADDADTSKCVHDLPADESETDVYCTDKDCPCAVHATEEFTAAWIPKQG
jgi:hypothetical protein